MRRFATPAGSTRFDESRRGVPRISPALLAKRLRELEAVGVIVRVTDGRNEHAADTLTAAGQDLMPVVVMGGWRQRRLDAQLPLKNLDPSRLMGEVRRKPDPAPLPPRRITTEVLYPDFDVDLHVTTDLRTMTAIWMRPTTVDAAGDGRQLSRDGATSMPPGTRRGGSASAPSPRKSAASPRPGPAPDRLAAPVQGDPARAPAAQHA